MGKAELQAVLEAYYKKLYDEHATFNYPTIESFKHAYGQLIGTQDMMNIALQAFQSSEDVRIVLEKHS